MVEHLEGPALSVGAGSKVLPTVRWLGMIKEQIISDGNDIIPWDSRSTVNSSYRFAGRDSRGVGFIPCNLLLVSHISSTSGRR
jgi:hypothetical protein